MLLEHNTSRGTLVHLTFILYLPKDLLLPLTKVFFTFIFDPHWFSCVQVKSVSMSIRWYGRDYHGWSIVRYRRYWIIFPFSPSTHLYLFCLRNGNSYNPGSFTTGFLTTTLHDSSGSSTDSYFQGDGNRTENSCSFLRRTLKKYTGSFEERFYLR